MAMAKSGEIWQLAKMAWRIGSGIMALINGNVAWRNISS